MSEITLNSLPKTLDELKAMPQAALTVPEEVAALTVAALALYPENPAETEKMPPSFQPGPFTAEPPATAFTSVLSLI